jgi:hypothetical protein
MQIMPFSVQPLSLAKLPETLTVEVCVSKIEFYFGQFQGIAAPQFELKLSWLGVEM